MKTSKEMQLKILDKMRENVENGVPIMEGVQFFLGGAWHNELRCELEFGEYRYRVKPQTITINGVEIQKPLSESEILAGRIYYYACNNKSLHGREVGNLIQGKGIRFVYETKEEAIEASKALFGIE